MNCAHCGYCVPRFRHIKCFIMVVLSFLSYRYMFAIKSYQERIRIMLGTAGREVGVDQT